MSKKKPDFSSDLDFANKYESAIAKYYGASLSNDKRWDIELNGKKIELKIDRYFYSKNFFIEEISDTKSGKSGGPYRSLEDNVDEFWYVFVNGEEAIVYKWQTKDLISQLHDIRGWEKLIRNKGWVTKGKLVKKTQLKCCPEEITLKV